jgi:hypothetical protein
MNLLFEGQLQSSPFHGEIFHSTFRQLELHTESDFVAFQQMARSRWAPVWMSFSQKSRFMSQVYQHILETVWDDVDRMLMVARVPSVRMPIELGQDKILQVVELAPEIQRLEALEESFLSLYDGFVRHPMESGNNELRLQWHRPRGADAAPKFDKLCEKLRAMGLQEAARHS